MDQIFCVWEKPTDLTDILHTVQLVKETSQTGVT